MLKNVWFQIHWFVGITAGVVLAIVGLTGGILSFESEIQSAMNSAVRKVEPASDARLEPAALVSALHEQFPDKRIAALTLSSDPTETVRVNFAPDGKAPAAPVQGRGGPRGETRYVNPYTGQAIAGQANRGEGFFRTTRSLHRWLTAGTFGNREIGKQIVGASTLLCVLLALSGLYLRWPRSIGNWRTWLTFDTALKGRSFLWHLHAVVGTWVLVGFLLMSLTGLNMSYDWFRNGVYALAGVERPVRRGEGGPGSEGAPRAGNQNVREQNSAAETPSDRPRREGGEQATDRPRRGDDAQPADRPRREGGNAGRANLDNVWATFKKETAPSGFSSATLTLPQQRGRPVEIRYFDANPAHERASNTLSLDAASGAVVRHERYADKRAGEKLVSSMFPLHSGSFFGLTGIILYMVASLSMPVFAVTGWMMYLDRRKKKRAANAARSAANKSLVPQVPGAQQAADTLLLAFASQAGSARTLAWQTAGSLQAAGIPVEVQSLDALKREHLQHARQALFVVSTFGEGEPPDEAKSFVRRLMRESVPLHQMQFGLLALGDLQYKTFCGFGRSLDQWLRTQGARALFPAVEVSNGDAKAIIRWREQLAAITGSAKLGAWEESSFSDWPLRKRELLNPGSIGGSTFHLELAPPAGEASTWQAGDIAEIQPGNSSQSVLAFLAKHALDGNVSVDTADGNRPLAEVLRYTVLVAKRESEAVQAFVQRLEPLPKREFSIASIPADGGVHLLIRQARKDDGTLGIGSGWLTEFAAVGDPIRLRLRTNPGFHPQSQDRPLILIGNGTGIAGLRSHLRARVVARQEKNWLIFGERNAAHDFYYRDEIMAWQSAGFLQQLDLAFSRDQEERIYVQHVLRERADKLREWIAEGAAVYVCGSAQGMAPAIDAALTELLGAATMTSLVDAGQYRRDVY
jgi:sulfite reductase (NADPH) flavoprotein alpha-component